MRAALLVLTATLGVACNARHPVRTTTHEAPPVDDPGDDTGTDGTTPGDTTTPPTPRTCSSCHGTANDPAPPSDTNGYRATSRPSVGAHQAHLQASVLFRTVACAECHVVPTDPEDPAHLVPPTLTWGPLAAHEGVTPSYAGGRCTVYCHGPTLPGGTLIDPEWTAAGHEASRCGACHALPPPSHAAVATPECGPCHPFRGIVPVDSGTHVNGTLEVLGCGGGHELPPASGAHDAHAARLDGEATYAYGDLRRASELDVGGGRAYAFGCGHCHPLTSSAHGNGIVDVDVAGGTAPEGSLKARNPATARYEGGRCSDVYCHSSGQEVPTYQTSPAWQGGHLAEPRCAACHDNPPAYASEGPGAPGANAHLVLTTFGSDEYEAGHFAGVAHWYHGAPALASAPVTCQTCHYGTVDPNNVGPGGFYYLDTTGSYDLGGLSPYDCTAAGCHTGVSGEQAQGTGVVLAGLHVNGRRDVIFDPRTEIPAGTSGIPGGAARPTYPYWAMLTISESSLPPGTALDGGTWSFTLAESTYEATTKSCGNIACHLAQSWPDSKPQYTPLAWGGAYQCNMCHQY